MRKTIFVAGATGMIGYPVVRALLLQAFNVRVLTRDPAKAEEMFGDDVKIIEGDLNDMKTLSEALKGCYGLHISLSGDIELPGTRILISQAVKSGIERITYISGATVSEENCWFPLINTKWQAEQEIKQCGIPYTIFCPTWFMESLRLMVRKGKALMFGKQPHPFHWVSATDFAKMAAIAYQTDSAANKRMFIYGPEAILMKDALTRYCQEKYPEIKEIPVLSIPMAKFLAFVMRRKGFKDVVRLFAYFEKVGEMGDPEEADEILGKPRTTLEKWLEKE